MGRGCALEAKRRYLNLAKHLGALLGTPDGNRVYYFPPDMVTFPVKHQWYEKADIELILSSAYELAAMANEHGWALVVMPRPGCGNGHLSWSDVRPVIEPLLDNRFVVCSFAYEI
jgi:hypothetical protein